MNSTEGGSVTTKRKSGEGVVEEGDATKKPKLSFGIKKATGATALSVKPIKKVVPISLKLGQQKPKEQEKKIVKPSGAAAKAFAEESDEEEEDMPPEAKMRMKNIGKNTPTSAGPNSFNKGKMGFSSPTAKWRYMMNSGAAEEAPASGNDEKS